MGAGVLFFTESELRRSVDLAESIPVIEGAFTQLAQGRVSLPPPMHLPVEESEGEVHIKTAHIAGAARYAVKIASGFHQNPQRDLASGSGMMMTFSAETGFLEAILLDNGYLTDVRTAAAGAVAATHLARPELKTIGMLGSGIQARYQVMALWEVRRFEEVLVYSRNKENVDSYVEEMESRLDARFRAAPDAKSVVRAADLLITATPSQQPLVKADWLRPGLHITAMGADSPEKQELEPEILARADRVVCDLRSQCGRIGELHHALAEGVLTEESQVAELGEVTAGRAPGRRDDLEITVCDLTGVGIQDTAIANFAVEQAESVGLGRRLAP
ncbi:MAG: cyclodeaminase [Anaerolineae bacterium]